MRAIRAIFVMMISMGTYSAFKPTIFTTLKPSQSIAAFNKIKSAGVALCIAVCIGNPLTSLATPLGEHSGCSYPACTTEEERLKAAAPGLMPQNEKEEQVQLLKDVEFTLAEFPALAEAKEYGSIRGGFRSYPGNSLRLTARKVKNFLEPTALAPYTKAYQTFIDDVDYVDLMASQRMQKRGSDEELKKAVTKVNLTYKLFMNTVAITPPPPALVPTPL